MSVLQAQRVLSPFLRVQSYKKILMGTYVLIIKADNTGKIGIYRFLREMACGLMG